jgi:AcrR family transcriptional regulator
VSPRPYRLGRRRVAVEETRVKILEAARDLLAAEGGVSAFTVDAVAEHAGVARMTVYYQFNSKPGLLEALFDHFAKRGLVDSLRAAFQRSQPLEALDALIAAFCGFWASDRVAIRRMRGLAAIDAEIDVSVRARDERRRDALRTILGRAAQQQPLRRPMDETVDVLLTLTSFEVFDSLAGTSRTTADVITLLTDLVHAHLQEASRPARLKRPASTPSKRPGKTRAD